MTLLKKIAARLPNSFQDELKRIHFTRQIKKGLFRTTEPEYDLLHNFITFGDWVIDIGANVGHYTKRFSELVGVSGRVIAVEPVPETFALLSANVQRFNYQNVSLFNVAVSDKIGTVGMAIPKFSTGLNNFYEAHITDSICAVSVMTIPFDCFGITQRVSLIKIDAEGHESFVLAGLKNIINTFMPVMIIETKSDEIVSDLKTFGYRHTKVDGSPNILFVPERK